MKLYMAVTADKYELPVVVTPYPLQLAEIFDIDMDYMFQCVKRESENKRYGVKFMIIEVEEDDEQKTTDKG